MKRRLEIQKATAAVGGVVDSCRRCHVCGGEALVDRPGDYDPLLPQYADWQEGFECYECDDVDGSTIAVYLMRCQRCSRVFNHVDRRTA
jgi:hypothetical protein